MSENNWRLIRLHGAWVVLDERGVKVGEGPTAQAALDSVAKEEK